MANFTVKIDTLEKASKEIIDQAETTLSYSQSISNITRTLSDFRGEAFYSICENLKLINDSILTEAARMDSLSKALQHIASIYSNAENKIATSFNTNRGPQINSDSESDNVNQSFFDRIIDIIKRIIGWDNKEESKSSNVVSREQEKTHDLYLQEQIFSLLDTENYCKRKWNNSTIEERKIILSEFLAAIATVFGVSISSRIDFYDGTQNNRGAYNNSTKTVRINENYLSRADSYSIMQTLIHEMRHAYQHSAVESPEKYTVSKETIEQWKNNFSNYRSTSSGYTYEEYVSQPIEYDAKNFAKQYSDITNAKPEYKGSWD